MSGFKKKKTHIIKKRSYNTVHTVNQQRMKKNEGRQMDHSL